MQITHNIFTPVPLMPLPVMHAVSSEPSNIYSEELIDAVRKDIRAQFSTQPIHRILARPAVYLREAESKRRTQEFEVVHTSKASIVIKSLVAGAGFMSAAIFAKSNLLIPPDNLFGAGLIGLVTVLMLPIVGAELTQRRLRKEFEIIPLKSMHLPSVKESVEKGCSPEKFCAFVEDELLSRVPRGHLRLLADDCGTCLHDIRCWRLEELYFPGTTWETVYRVISDLNVDADTAIRVKAALLAMERDRLSKEDPSRACIDAAIADIISK
jgi:hypothetical protein